MSLETGGRDIDSVIASFNQTRRKRANMNDGNESEEPENSNEIDMNERQMVVESFDDDRS